MPANRLALIRYKALDECLRNRYRRWTLEDLMDKVSDVLYEFEGIDKGISRRTIQADLQMMRSDKLGYNAPIIVVDRKYYQYEDPTYSITQIPLSAQDLSRMSEAVAVLKQFKGFSHFNQLTEVVQKLEDHVYAAAHAQPAVIDFEKNENLRGLNYLDVLYQAVIHRKALLLTYQSFRARAPQQIVFHIWWLKEFRNRWFAVGISEKGPTVLHLALDRMLDVQPTDAEYRPNENYNPETFYRDVIGVTVGMTSRPMHVRILVNPENAPYVETKPLHASQKVLERRAEGMVIGLFVQLNMELEKEILGYGEGMTVLAPERLRRRLKDRLASAVVNYAVLPQPDATATPPGLISQLPASQSAE
ncbi:helix-turn-helix transcriptional regulator [Tellurirhabdus rosea]|uniref:helix-turn-helix transcriptional regulator n=1 Tax=Tellurirhabdus rosea TaxID=2674997 RepID=UPI002251B9EC|nr:WYL domain-containing protein [Tellurirhabdus rosea]